MKQTKVKCLYIQHNIKNEKNHFNKTNNKTHDFEDLKEKYHFTKALKIRLITKCQKYK